MEDNKAKIQSAAVMLFTKGLLLVKFLIDAALIVACYWFSFFLRFEGLIPPDRFLVFQETLFVFAFSFFVCDLFFGLAKGIWRYTSLRDIERVGLFVLAGNGLSILLSLVFLYNVTIEIPRSIYIINSILLFLSISWARLSYRIIFDKLHRMRRKRENVLIVGDQDMAASLQYSILKDYSHQFKIVGFITFNKNRLGDTINAIPIIGTIDEVPSLVKTKDIKYIFIAVDSTSTDKMKYLIKVCQESEALVRIMPSMFDVVNGKIPLKDIREVKFEDYLEREPVKFDVSKVKDAFFKKNILVTGGGGSIGASICKEIIKFFPSKLLILDISETNLFRISQELNEVCQKLKLRQTELIYKIMDVRDAVSLEKLFDRHPIDYVIHAAALKHVCFCEDNSIEAISTNVSGTLNTMIYSIKARVEKFIYISTDKAVEPLSVMGATKRAGELLVKNFSGNNSVLTKFMGVRFGNVVGSSGNVVEIFMRQLQNKEPLTITDPEMTRYFMSLDEATKLILEAISLGEGGEIFVLDMGSPIKIEDLAYDIALFYGTHLKPKDIIYIGKKKGERTFERLCGEKEHKLTTSSGKIFKVEQTLPMEGLLEKITNLAENIYQYEEPEARERLFSIISTSEI